MKYTVGWSGELPNLFPQSLSIISYSTPDNCFTLTLQSYTSSKGLDFTWHLSRLEEDRLIAYMLTEQYGGPGTVQRLLEEELAAYADLDALTAAVRVSSLLEFMGDNEEFARPLFAVWTASLPLGIGRRDEEPEYVFRDRRRACEVWAETQALLLQPIFERKHG